MEKKNLIAFVSKESIYSSVTPILWGAIIQQFLLHRGVSTAMIGIYTTLVPCAQTAAMIFLSGAVEQTKNPLRFCTGMIALAAVLAAAYLPVMYWDLGDNCTVILVCVISLTHISIYSCKSICDFRGNYQIVSPERYGTMIFLACAISGAAGVGYGWMFSLLVDRNTGGNPFFICMLVTLLLLSVATVANSLLKPIYPAFTPQRKSLSLWSQAKMLMDDRSFRQLLIPNMLRGVTSSVFECIVMIALVMGIDESGRAKLPMVCALATALASALYLLLRRKFPASVINLLGGTLTCTMILLPRENAHGFLGLFFVAYLGRVIVDNTIPVMLFPIIAPEVAGIYNAWRTALIALCSIIATPVICALVEIVNPLLLLAFGGMSCFAVTAWYYVVCRKLQTTQNGPGRKRSDCL